MSKEKYGFVYIWFDRKHRRYYVGCRWGSIDDGYVCSSKWMKQAYGHRPYDFKRRILVTNIPSRQETYIEEQKWLDMIRPEEIKPINDKPRYYNLCVTNNKVWHMYDENIKTIGQKISIAKRGKSIGPCSQEKARAISESKKKKFAERGGMTDEHKQKLSDAKKGTKRSVESKQKTSETLKQKWENGEWSERKAKPKETMSREEQDKLCSHRLKSKWADPIWAENQKKKLKESWDRRKNK